MHIYRITPRGLQVSRSVSGPVNDENWQVLRAASRTGLSDDSKLSSITGLPEGTVRAIAGRLKRQGLLEEG